jgi:hypothetical protein
LPKAGFSNNIRALIPAENFKIQPQKKSCSASKAFCATILSYKKLFFAARIKSNKK